MGRSNGRRARATIPSNNAPEHASPASAERLLHLYEISKELCSFETPRATLTRVLGLATETLPLRTAIVLTARDGRVRTVTWHAEGESESTVAAATQHAQTRYAKMTGSTVAAVRERSDEPQTLLPGPPSTPRPRPRRAGEDFLVLPLTIDGGGPLGVLQLQAVDELGETDRTFVDAFAHQLAIALDRFDLWSRDIARREEAERAEARLQEALEARAHILRVVSHDLRNPIGNIVMAITVHLQSAASKGRSGVMRSTLGTIERSARRMIRLIEDLSDFGSIEAGGLNVVPSNEDAVSMLEEVVSSFESTALVAGVRLQVRASRAAPSVSCDRDRILQVLSNMVANALKVTATGGEIELGIDLRGREAVFSVRDTGHGIAAEELEHVFDLYWRSARAGYGGTGLGLAIARGIVVAHGGVVWVESEVDRGTTFFFTLSLAGRHSGLLVRTSSARLERYEGPCAP